MNDGADGSLLCCLLSVLLAEEAHDLKARFPALLEAALSGVAPGERVVMETRDGVLAAFLGNPESALHTALALRDAAASQDLRMGLNLGPVQLARDLEGRIDVRGDGMELAQLLASFAEPGGLVVSRAYYEVAARLSAESSRRLHDLPVAGAGDPAQVLADVEGPRREPSPMQGYLFIGALFVASVAGSFYAVWRHDHGVAGAAPRLAAVTPGKPPGDAPATERAREADAAVPAPSPAPAPLPDVRVVLAVAPWGEVYVDGGRRGITPPLKSFSLPPGQHLIEIRNADFPPYTARIDAGAGNAIRIEHRF